MILYQAQATVTINSILTSTHLSDIKVVVFVNSSGQHNVPLTNNANSSHSNNTNNNNNNIIINPRNFRNMSLLHVFQQQRMVVWLLLLSLSWYIIATATTSVTNIKTISIIPIVIAFAIDPQVISLSSYSLASSSFRRTMPIQSNRKNGGSLSSSPLFSTIGSSNHAIASASAASPLSSTTMLRYQMSSTLNEEKLTQYPWRRKNNNQQQQRLVSNDNHHRDSSSNENQSNNRNNEFIIFCDLDGVLCDFEYGVRQIFQHEIECCHTKPFPINELKRKQVLWNRIQQSCGSQWEHNNNENKIISGDEQHQQQERLPFFEALPWTQDGKVLWYQIIQRIMKQKYQYPIHILTGCPPYSESRIEKFNWCRRELLKYSSSSTTNIQHMDMAGPLRLHIPQKTTAAAAPTTIRTNNNNEAAKQSVFYHNNNDENHIDNDNNDDDTTYVITCWSEKKYQESKPGNILIDDRLDLKDSWESNGGTFIHHQTGNLEATIEQLIFHGIISYDDINETIIDVVREQKEKLREQHSSTAAAADRSMYVW